MKTHRHSTAASPSVRLSFNSLWLLSARVGGQLLGLVFTLTIARSLGEDVFGQFAFISAVVFIGNVLTTFGLDTLLIREVAASRKSAPDSLHPLADTLNAALALQLGLSALYLAAVGLFGRLLSDQTADTLPAMVVATLSLIPLAFSTVYSAILRGYERMDAFLVFSLIPALVMGLGGAIIWLRGGTLLGVAWVLLLGQTVGAVAAAVLYKVVLPNVDWRWRRPPRAMVGRIFRISAMLALLMVLAMLYQRLGVLVLSLMAGDAATGVYSAAARVLEALKIIPGAFFGALLPMMIARPERDTRRLYSWSFAALVGLSVMMAASAVLLAEPIINLLFGPSYAAAVPILRILSWSLPLTVLTFKLSFDLVVAGQERIAALAMLLTLMISIVVTVWFVGRWGVNGAAVALIIGEGTQTLCLASLARYHRGHGATANRPVGAV